MAGTKQRDPMKEGLTVTVSACVDLWSYRPPSIQSWTLRGTHKDQDHPAEKQKYLRKNCHKYPWIHALLTPIVPLQILLILSQILHFIHSLLSSPFILRYISKGSAWIYFSIFTYLFTNLLSTYLCVHLRPPEDNFPKSGFSFHHVYPWYPTEAS